MVVVTDREITIGCLIYVSFLLIIKWIYNQTQPIVTLLPRTISITRAQLHQTQVEMAQII